MLDINWIEIPICIVCCLTVDRIAAWLWDRYKERRRRGKA